MNSIQTALHQFQRGLAHDSTKDIYEGHRALYKLGAAAISAIEPNVLDGDWKNVTHREMIRILAGHVGLIHDIDETRSCALIDCIIERGCDQSVQAILESIRRFTKDEYRIFEIGGVEVWVQRNIRDDGHLPSLLETWLSNVPTADLAGIARITVVPETETMDYEGLYMPVLATIVLVWNELNQGKGPLARMFRLCMENTLYHEIGHHRLGHEVGHDREQEKDANKYAAALFTSAHPRAMRAYLVFIQALNWLSFGYIKSLCCRVLNKSHSSHIV